MIEPVLPKRRRDFLLTYPNWMRLGDGVALFLIGLILAGGFFSYGYVTDAAARGWAYLGCALLGCWSAAGLAFGRWGGALACTSRRAILVGIFFLLWTGLQRVPLPAGLVTTLSRPWREARDAHSAAGLDFPAWIPLAHSPALAGDSWNVALAALLFFSAVLMLCARRSCAIWLVGMVATISVIEGLAGAWSFFFEGQHRAHGLGAFNPNHHAALVIAGLPLVFAGVLQWSRLSQRFTASLWSGSNPLIMLYGLGLLAAVGWMASLSRSSLLLGGIIVGAWAASEIIAARRDHEREPLSGRARVLGAAVLGMALLIGALLLESTHIPRELVGRADPESRWVDRGRVDFARASMAGMMEAPVSGLGLRGAEHAMTRHLRQPTLLTPVWTHNDPVQLVAELGVIGSLLLLGLAAWAARAFVGDFRSWREIFDPSEGLLQRAAWAGLLAVAAHSLTDFHLRVPLVGFTVLILLALVLRPGPLLVAAFAKR